MEECARMGCDKEAVALLTFAPTQAKAWLYDLEQADPAGGISLCRRHANATVVPMSWQLIDGRDPAWPGPARTPDASDTATGPTVSVTDDDRAPSRELKDMTPQERVEAMVGVADLPSDAASHDREFAALTDGLPVTVTQYAEPRVATLRAAGVGVERDAADEGDPSLFELPLSDVPAVTPHPGFG